jgi:hypothetical protein
MASPKSPLTAISAGSRNVVSGAIPAGGDSSCVLPKWGENKYAVIMMNEDIQYIL